MPFADYFPTLPDTLAGGTAETCSDRTPPTPAKDTLLPAAQQGFFDHRQGRGVDTRWFGEAGGTATAEAPTGPRFGAGAKAFQPVPAGRPSARACRPRKSGRRGDPVGPQLALVSGSRAASSAFAAFAAFSFTEAA
ncbi:hypothetical protein [Pseudonocardia sp. T1-2H]|uniref:hypothetical protein n=1 Tax=Pseudonocardia sp. T1-2H TaxID=3128899 RepID=UPI0031010961